MHCDTCRHARTPDHPAMRGWINCALEQAPWHYLMPTAVCQFNPSAWALKS